jgi:hypothetical protein
MAASHELDGPVGFGAVVSGNPLFVELRQRRNTVELEIREVGPEEGLLNPTAQAPSTFCDLE